jgi:hypothetical protein
MPFKMRDDSSKIGHWSGEISPMRVRFRICRALDPGREDCRLARIPVAVHFSCALLPSLLFQGDLV